MEGVVMSDLIVSLAEQMLQARKLAKRILEHGELDTSVLIGHEVVIKNSVAELKTTMTVLPIRRIYKRGAKIVTDSTLTFESMEDWSL